MGGWQQHHGGAVRARCGEGEGLLQCLQAHGLSVRRKTEVAPLARLPQLTDSGDWQGLRHVTKVCNPQPPLPASWALADVPCRAAVAHTQDAGWCHGR
jgi:hypothetical protein